MRRIGQPLWPSLGDVPSEGDKPSASHQYSHPTGTTKSLRGTSSLYKFLRTGVVCTGAATVLITTVVIANLKLEHDHLPPKHGIADVFSKAKPFNRTDVKCSKNSTVPLVEEICETPYVLLDPKPLICVFTSLLPRDSHFVDSFMEDVLQQSLSAPKWSAPPLAFELVVASYEKPPLEKMLDAAFRGGHMQRRFRMRTVLLTADPGLYEVWDLLIEQFCTGDYLMNWNIDDRKHPLSIQKKAQVLLDHSEAAMVSSVVIVSLTEKLNWAGAMENGSLPRMFHRLQKSRPGNWVPPSEMINMERDTHQLAGVCDYPNNSPMWRRSVHAVVGGFAQQVQRHGVATGNKCADWAVWLRAMLAGQRLWHIHEELEVYYVSPQSLGHRDAGAAQVCRAQVFDEFRPLALYNNVYFRRSRKPTYYHHVLVVHGTVPAVTSFTDIRLRQIVRWLVFNGHNVTVSYRMRKGLRQQELEAQLQWYHRLGVDLIADSLHFEKTLTLVRERKLPITAAILGIFTWREFGVNRQSENTTTYFALADLLRKYQLKDRPMKIVAVSDEAMRFVEHMVPSSVHLQGLRRKEQIAYLTADMAVAASDADGRRIKALAPAANVVVLPVVLEPVEPMDRSAVVRRTTRCQKRMNLLFVGTPHYANELAVDFLLNDIFPELQKRGHDVHLRIVGSAAWSRKVQVACSNRQLEQDALQGRSFTVDLAEDLAWADVMVAPSFANGSGLTSKVLHGLAHGLPVVTTAAGGKQLPCLEHDTSNDTAWSACGLLLVVPPGTAAFVDGIENGKKVSCLPHEVEQALSPQHTHEGWLRRSAWMDFWVPHKEVPRVGGVHDEGVLNVSSYVAEVPPETKEGYYMAFPPGFLSTDHDGLRFFHRPDQLDVHIDLPIMKWGYLTYGAREVIGEHGGEWLKVDTLYLPFRYQDFQVLVRVGETQVEVENAIGAKLSDANFLPWPPRLAAGHDVNARSWP